MILFFGDSITNAENNNFNGFVEKLNNEDCINKGVSGTCIGDYSLYPVGKNNLIDKIEEEKELIKKGDYIFLEYGSNDISSVFLDYTSIKRVLIDLVKCKDAIAQINPNIKIYFILLGENKMRFLKGQIDYLKNDYFKSIKEIVIDEPFDHDLYYKWLSNYTLFDFSVRNTFKNVIDLPLLNEDEVDKDNMHPNDKGYLKISKCIKGVING